MQVYHYAQSGASGSYTLLSLGNSLVRATLGPDPVFDIATLAAPENMALRQFVLADLGRSIAHPGLKPLQVVSFPMCHKRAYHAEHRSQV
jgi:hypothetical protein